MNVLMRKLQLALTPQTRLLKTKLSNGAIVYGKNSTGFGGRGIYIYRDAIEPEFEHLDKLLDSEGVFIDVGANTGIYTIKAANPDFSPKSSNPYKIWIMGFHTASKINLVKNARNRFSIRII